MKKTLGATAAALVLSACLAGTANADPGDSLPVNPTPTGPTCYGRSYTYHVWNLFHPMEVYGIDSCSVNLMIAHRRAGSTFAQFLAALAAARYPAVGVPASVLTFGWNMTTDALGICAAPGRGVELTVSNISGQVIHCRAQ